MKQKIIEQLKAYLKTLGVKNLSATRIDAIADKLALKITDETTIEARLTELNDIHPFADIAKQDDRLRTLEAKKEPKKDPADTIDPAEPAKTPDDAPQWAKDMAAQNKTLLDKVTQLEAGRAAADNTSKLVAILKEKKVPEGYYKSAVKGRVFKDDAEIEAFATELVTDYTTFNQGETNNALSNQPKPILAVATDKATEVSPEMKSYLDSKKKEQSKVA
jgi:hypothetical protein